MNLFDMERKLSQGRTIPNKAAQQQVEMAKTASRLAEQMRAERLLEMEDMLERRDAAISEMIQRAGMTREAARRRIFAEKAAFKKKLVDKLFVEAVYDMTMAGLLLDEDFKEAHAGNIHWLVEGTVRELMESGEIDYRRIKREGSEVMRRIVRLCEDIAEREAAELFDPNDANSRNSVILTERDRKKAASEAPISKEGKAEFDDAKADDVEAVADIVKEKVVSVIRAEQEAARREQEINEEIEGETAEADEEIEGEIESAEDETDAEDPEAAGGEEGEEETSAKAESFRLIRRPGKPRQHSLFKSIQINVANKFLSEQKNLSESGRVEIDMDLVLAEAITYYTLLETLYTVGLIDGGATRMRKLAQELVIRK